MWRLVLFIITSISACCEFVGRYSDCNLSYNWSWSCPINCKFMGHISPSSKCDSWYFIWLCCDFNYIMIDCSVIIKLCAGAVGKIEWSVCQLCVSDSFCVSSLYHSIFSFYIISFPSCNLNQTLINCVCDAWSDSEGMELLHIKHYNSRYYLERPGLTWLNVKKFIPQMTVEMPACAV